MEEGETIVFTEPPHLSTLSLPSSLHIPPKRRRLLRDRGFFSAHRNYLAIAVKSHSKEVWAGELGEETFLSFTLRLVLIQNARMHPPTTEPGRVARLGGVKDAPARASEQHNTIIISTKKDTAKLELTNENAKNNDDNARKGTRTTARTT